jgi:hypothetical protein
MGCASSKALVTPVRQMMGDCSGFFPFASMYPDCLKYSVLAVVSLDFSKSPDHFSDKYQQSDLKHKKLLSFYIRRAFCGMGKTTVKKEKRQSVCAVPLSEDGILSGVRRWNDSFIV